MPINEEEINKKIAEVENSLVAIKQLLKPTQNINEDQTAAPDNAPSLDKIVGVFGVEDGEQVNTLNFGENGDGSPVENPVEAAIKMLKDTQAVPYTDPELMEGLWFKDGNKRGYEQLAYRFADGWTPEELDQIKNGITQSNSLQESKLPRRITPKGSNVSFILESAAPNKSGKRVKYMGEAYIEEEIPPEYIMFEGVALKRTIRLEEYNKKVLAESKNGGKIPNKIKIKGTSTVLSAVDGKNGKKSITSDAGKKIADAQEKKETGKGAKDVSGTTKR